MMAALSSLRTDCAELAQWARAWGVAVSLPKDARYNTNTIVGFDERSNTDSSSLDRQEKDFRTLQAQFALIGVELNKGRSSSGTLGFYATCGGAERWLESLDEARAYLEQIGGNHG